MKSRGRDADAEFLLDLTEIDCSLDETSSEGIDWEYAGLMRWEGQAIAMADASGGAETYSFLYVDMKEQTVNRS